mmetsp:Transcript_4972/g.12081  ORF Transcript_4972/g.12081 Transcript_4972/m.12081 type:complete len:209 (+) Transcript_4972:765-1391(+)
MAAAVLLPSPASAAAWSGAMLDSSYSSSSSLTSEESSSSPKAKLTPGILAPNSDGGCAAATEASLASMLDVGTGTDGGGVDKGADGGTDAQAGADKDSANGGNVVGCLIGVCKGVGAATVCSGVDVPVANPTEPVASRQDDGFSCSTGDSAAGFTEAVSGTDARSQPPWACHFRSACFANAAARGVRDAARFCSTTTISMKHGRLLAS